MEIREYTEYKAEEIRRFYGTVAPMSRFSTN